VPSTHILHSGQFVLDRAWVAMEMLVIQLPPRAAPSAGCAQTHCSSPLPQHRLASLIPTSPTRPQASESLYGVISAGRQVVALEAGRGAAPLSVLDVQLLLNFLASNDALRWVDGVTPHPPGCQSACA
jgi:hypothetical protein